jgi:hypothetical protein
MAFKCDSNHYKDEMKMRWAEHVARMGEIRNTYKILIGKRDMKRLPARSKRRG